MKQRKTYDDDDGRTIADMSGVQRSNLFVPRSLKKNGTFAKEEEQPDDAAPEQFTGRQRRLAVGGALTAAVLIAGVFIGAGAIVIALLTLVWQ